MKYRSFFSYILIFIFLFSSEAAAVLCACDSGHVSFTVLSQDDCCISNSESTDKHEATAQTDHPACECWDIPVTFELDFDYLITKTFEADLFLTPPVQTVVNSPAPQTTVITKTINDAIPHHLFNLLQQLQTIIILN